MTKEPYLTLVLLGQYTVLGWAEEMVNLVIPQEDFIKEVALGLRLEKNYKWM